MARQARSALHTSCVTSDELASVSLRLLICEIMKAVSFYPYFPPCQLRALASKGTALSGSMGLFYPLWL